MWEGGVKVRCGSTPQRVWEAGVEVRVGAHFGGRGRLGSRSSVVGPGPPVAFRHCAGGCLLPDPLVTLPLEGSLPCHFFLLKGSCWVGPHPLTPLTLLKAPPPNTVKLGWGGDSLCGFWGHSQSTAHYPHC